ncbi:hypothetical protein LZ31DRAFT_577598 [Colletotrichum somersetense]|nr:hypothetical protein LZ31DRAFT_577598 [Colletotrichum somersetense]
MAMVVVVVVARALFFLGWVGLMGTSPLRFVRGAKPAATMTRYVVKVVENGRGKWKDHHGQESLPDRGVWLVRVATFAPWLLKDRPRRVECGSIKSRDVKGTVKWWKEGSKGDVEGRLAGMGRGVGSEPLASYTYPYSVRYLARGKTGARAQGGLFGNTAFGNPAVLGNPGRHTQKFDNFIQLSI